MRPKMKKKVIFGGANTSVGHEQGVSGEVGFFPRPEQRAKSEHRLQFGALVRCQPISFLVEANAQRPLASGPISSVARQEAYPGSTWLGRC